MLTNTGIIIIILLSLSMNILQCFHIIVLILSNTGIYVLMFENIIVTFSHTVFLSVLLLIAFSVAFYMAFFSPGIEFTPFSNPALSFFSTMTYATGNVEFNDLFSLSHDGNQQRDIPFPPVSIMLWITFLIIMIILLINMLVRDLFMSHEYHVISIIQGSFHFHVLSCISCPCNIIL